MTFRNWTVILLCTSIYNGYKHTSSSVRSRLRFFSRLSFLWLLCFIFNRVQSHFKSLPHEGHRMCTKTNDHWQHLNKLAANHKSTSLFAQIAEYCSYNFCFAWNTTAQHQFHQSLQTKTTPQRAPRRAHVCETRLDDASFAAARYVMGIPCS